MSILEKRINSTEEQQKVSGKLYNKTLAEYKKGVKDSGSPCEAATARTAARTTTRRMASSPSRSPTPRQAPKVALFRRAHTPPPSTSPKHSLPQRRSRTTEEERRTVRERGVFGLCRGRRLNRSLVADWSRGQAPACGRGKRGGG